MHINKNTIKKTTDFLGKEGVNFFKKMKRNYGEVSPVYNDHGFPHAVHFSEGMQVRNFLTGQLNFSWADVEEGWIDVIEEVIKTV